MLCIEESFPSKMNLLTQGTQDREHVSLVNYITGFTTCPLVLFLQVFVWTLQILGPISLQEFVFADPDITDYRWPSGAPYPVLLLVN